MTKKRELLLLLSLLLMFSGFFFIALVNLKRGLAVFGLGIPFMVEDYLILILSLLSVVKIFWSVLTH